MYHKFMIYGYTPPSPLSYCAEAEAEPQSPHRRFVSGASRLRLPPPIPLSYRAEAEAELPHQQQCVEVGDGRFTMSIDFESEGTLSFIKKMDILYAVIADNKFMMVDELDKSLHHDLMVYFLQTFLLNESEAQILFTIHDQLILTEDFMRRDMVWFTEKNEDSAATELFSADDFNLHKNASIFNAYKLGKLGARPRVGSPFFKIKQTNEKE